MESASEKKKGQVGQEIGTLTMENYRMRSIIDSLDDLITTSVVDHTVGENRQEK